MNERKFWVSRDGGVCRDHLVLWSCQPLCREFGGVIRFSNTAHGKTPSKLEVFHGTALGLPHEIPPGECWEVTWAEAYCGAGLNPIMVPCARNVTDELKEENDAS